MIARLFPRILAVLAFGLVAADEPKVTETWTGFHNASDAPALAEGISVPQAGEYTVKAWLPEGSAWTFSAEGPVVTLQGDGTSGTGAPSWKTLGVVRAGRAERITFHFPRSKVERTSKKGMANDGPEPWIVPPALILTTDAAGDPSPLLDLVRGRIDSASPSPDLRRTTARTNQEGADFQPPATAAAWRERARELREQLLVTNGLWPSPPKTPLRPKVVGTLDRDGYVIEKVVLETLPGVTLSGNVYRPKDKTGRLPGVLSPHGHYADGRVNVDVQHRCVGLAKLGCVVFMYDMVGYNDSKPFGHEFLNDRLKRWGLNLVTLQTWNSIRALDYLTDRPDVDPARIGCTGESGGGTQTFLLTAIDDRVKVAAPVVMVSEEFQGGCVCENCAGMRHGTDNVEIAALTAPRPLKLVGATGDWTKHTMSRIAPPIRAIYELLGKSEHLSVDLFDYQHNYNQTSRNAVYPFLAYWLLGVENPEGTREGDQSIESPEALLTFTEANPAPANLKSAEAVEADLIRSLGWAIEELAPGTSSAAWESSRRYLGTSHRVRTGLSNPPAETLETSVIRGITHGGVQVIHAEVGRVGEGDRVPLVRWVPAEATGRVTVIATTRGKAELLDREAPASKLARELIKRGQGVVFFDPFLVGESANSNRIGEGRPRALHFECYNPSIAEDQMQDLATVVAWTRFQPGVREVSLVGFGAAGAQALVARPALQGLARTALDLDDVELGDGSNPLPSGLDLPGLFQFGGLKAAAALTSPAPLWLIEADRSVDRSWPMQAYALDDASGRLKISESRPTAEALARWIDLGE